MPPAVGIDDALARFRSSFGRSARSSGGAAASGGLRVGSSMSRRLLVALAVAGIVLVGVATALVLHAHGFKPDAGQSQDLAEIALDGIWIATGLIAWRRRPENRVGLLMVAAGFADLTGQLYWSSSLPFLLSAALTSLQ